MYLRADAPLLTVKGSVSVAEAGVEFMFASLR